jgi:hypothetical protein
MSLYLVGRKPVYISTGRGVTDPLTGVGFSVAELLLNMHGMRVIYLLVVHRIL